MTVRAIEIARGAWGAALLLRPADVLHAADGLTVDPRSTVVTRVLGARHVSQAVLSGVSPSPDVLAMGVWVDAAHAVCSLALATSDRPRTRAGLVDAAVAALWAGLGYRDLANAQATPAGHDRIRDDLARRVLAVVPYGRQLQRLADRARVEGAPAEASAPRSGSPAAAGPKEAQPTGHPDEQPVEESTRFVVIRPEGDIADSDLASVFEGQWRERADLEDPSGIELDGPHGVVRAVPTDRVEQSPDGSLGQVYEVPETPGEGSA
jgi:hypothetical protein